MSAASRNRELADDLARRTERLRAEPGAEDDAAPINPLAAAFNAEQGTSDRAAERIFPSEPEPEAEPPAAPGTPPE